MAEPLRTAALRAEPNVYDLHSLKIMGRQAAGNGLLRAAIAARAGGPVYGYTPHAESARHFAATVRAQDPEAPVTCLKPQNPHTLAEAGGVLYVGDPMLTAPARLRLRVGLAHHALCGVTHTMASAGILQEIAELLAAPLAAWDAVVCTSTAAHETATRIIEAQGEYLRWKFGAGISLSAPRLPIIPLGVFPEDFACTTDAREAARVRLGLGPDEVAAVYVGRLAYRAKAHPFPMYLGLQQAAERTGKKVALILCGQAASEAIADVFTTGAARFSPDVRLISLDGREPAAPQTAYAAGDLFVSLSDGLQETFGLTPLEAMAAALPVVVTDWNGYRDTVRDGVDGFRIPTWTPAEDDDNVAGRYEANELNYDAFHGSLAASTSVDLVALVEALSALIGNSDLRRKMGEAGRQRAREVFDWRGVYRQYQALWGEMNARRLAALANPEELAALSRAPKVSAAGVDPFQLFRHYPTARLTADTMVSLPPGVTLQTHAARQEHTSFRGAVLPPDLVARIIDKLIEGPRPVHELNLPRASLTIVGVLAKMGLVHLT